MATINYFQLTPEQACKTFEDYVRTKKESEALTMLFRYLSSYQSRNRRANYYDQGDTSVASNIHYLQKLMLSYIDLRLDAGVGTVEESNQLKEVFKSYRYMTQHQHTDAFLEVLETYKDKVESMFNERIKGYPLEELQKLPYLGQQQTEDPADDFLAWSYQPDVKQQKDQMKANLRLIWDAYRIIIENVKWNEKMESIYFEVLRKVADYCTRYRRKEELKWFLEQIGKFVSELNLRELDFKKNPSHVDLTKSSVNDKHVNIRFELVRTAIQLGVWQEAFKTLEQVLVLKQMRKGPFRTSHLLVYFEQLSQIFQKSGSLLYAAFAYYNHFLAFKKKPVQTAEDLQQKANDMINKVNQLTLRVLVIPLHETPNTESRHKEKMQQLFGARVPTRDELLKTLQDANTIILVSPAVRRIYNLFEGESDLLTLAENAKVLFKELVQENKDFNQFVPMLEDILIMKVLKGVSNVFTTVKMEKLFRLLNGVSRDRIQQHLVYANAHGLISCRIDFVSGFVQFKEEQFPQDSNVLPNLFLQLQKLAALVVERPGFQQELTQVAFKTLQSSSLEMITRSQTIKTLNKLSDPSQVEKYQRELREREKKEFEEERREEERRRQWEDKQITDMEQKRAKELASRNKLLQDIIKLKGKRFVTFEIKGEQVRIEKLKEKDLLEIDTNILSDFKKKLEDEAKKNADDRYVTRYKRTEYIERERKLYEVQNLKWDDEKDKQLLQSYEQEHKKRHDENIKLKHQLEKGNDYVKSHLDKILQEREKIHSQELENWRDQLKNLFNDKIIARAKELYQEAQEEKTKKAHEEEEARQRWAEMEEIQKKEQFEQRNAWKKTSDDKANLSDAFANRQLVRNIGEVTKVQVPPGPQTRPSQPLSAAATQPITVGIQRSTLKAEPPKAPVADGLSRNLGATTTTTQPTPPPTTATQQTSAASTQSGDWRGASSKQQPTQPQTQIPQFTKGPQQPAQQQSQPTIGRSTQQPQLLQSQTQQPQPQPQQTTQQSTIVRSTQQPQTQQPQPQQPSTTGFSRGTNVQPQQQQPQQTTQQQGGGFRNNKGAELKRNN